MDAQTKTDKLIRLDIPLKLLVGHEYNPNEMKQREFDLLCDNLQEVGFTDAIVVSPQNLDAFLDIYEEWSSNKVKFVAKLHTALVEAKIAFDTISGHHRGMAADYLGFKNVPCTIIVDDDFGEEQQEMQLLRHNTIHGQMNPDKFMRLYNKWADKYSKDIIQDMFGFADESAMNKLITETKKSLPKELQAEFKKASKEIKTIDDLSKVLNKLFNTYGDTLPYGFMVFDFGGKESVWVRMSTKDKGTTLDAFEHMIQSKKQVSGIFTQVMAAIANGDESVDIQELVANCPDASYDDGATLETLKTLE